jgi:hypothetical protein
MPNPGRDAEDARAEPALDALTRRVAALEAEQATLMERYARQLESSNEQLRALLRSSSDTASAPVAFTASAPSGHSVPTVLTVPGAPNAAARLAHTLAVVESQADDVERLAAAGDLASAVDTALMVTQRSAAALRATLADAELRQQLVTSMAPEDPVSPPVGIQNYMVTMGQNRSVPFRDAEITVLHLAGLPRALAEKHVDAAVTEYETLAAPRPPVDLHQVLDRIEAVQRAVADVEAVLPFAVNHPPQRLRWRKLVTYGLGGTLIVAANAGASLVLGPVAAAVSGAVGSAALGAALAPLVM